MERFTKDSCRFSPSGLNDVAAMTVVRFVLELFLLSDLSSSKPVVLDRCKRGFRCTSCEDVVAFMYFELRTEGVTGGDIDDSVDPSSRKDCAFRMKRGVETTAGRRGVAANEAANAASWDVFCREGDEGDEGSRVEASESSH